MRASSLLKENFLVILALVGASVWLGIASLGSINANPVAFVLLYSLAFLAYYLGVQHVLKQQQAKHALVLILLTGLVLRILVLGGPPSDDIYRYLWEGKVQRYGLNPYVYPPDAPELASLRDSTTYADQINHKDWTAIYPPVVMLWHRLFGDSVLALKVSFLLAEGILLFFLSRLLLLRHMSSERMLIYWWNPLPIWAFSLEGHHGAVGLAFLMAAFYGLVSMRSQIVSAIAWTAAVLSKGFALVVWPILATRMKISEWAWALIFGLMVFLPFLDSGSGLWKSLTQFGGELHYNDSLHAVFSLSSEVMDASHPLVSRFLSLMTGLGVLIWVMLKVNPDPLLRAAWLIGGLLLVMPTVHAWYVITLLPFLCFFPWSGWLFLTGTCMLPFLAQLEIYHTGEWVEWHWLKPIEYAPLFGWLCWSVLKKWKRRDHEKPWSTAEKPFEISCP